MTATATNRIATTPTATTPTATTRAATTRAATTRSAIHDRVYVDTLALRDPRVSLGFSAVAALLLALLWVTALYAVGQDPAPAVHAATTSAIEALPAIGR